MTEEAVEAGHPASLEEDGPVPGLDRPPPPLDGAPRIENGEVEFGTLGDPVEHLGAERRRLGDDQREAHRAGWGGEHDAREPPRGAAAPHRAGDGARREDRIEPKGISQQHWGGARVLAGEAGGEPRRRVPGSGSVPRVHTLERVDERQVGRERVVEFVPLDAFTRAEPPRELRPVVGQTGCEQADLAERDAPLQVSLELAALVAGLTWVDAVEDQRLREIPPAAEFEHPRPQVVVLALAEASVVAKAVPLEQLAVEEDRRVVEGRGEQRVPAHLRVRPGHRVHAEHVASLIDVRDGAAEDRRRVVLHRCQLPLKPPGSATSSASSLAIHRPLAASRPRLSDSARPERRSLRSTTSLGSVIPARIAAVSSVDASSTTRSSRSRIV